MIPQWRRHSIRASFSCTTTAGARRSRKGATREARRELEAAQRLRPDDADVLNLLGLVYFKTNAFPEAEVIYRRLIRENPNVFILHSNLGLILFKQGKHDEAEHFLLRAVELRPNYAKSHLYLGLLYRQKKKYGLALEHLKFAGADKLVREVELEMRPPAPPPPKPAPPSRPAVNTERSEDHDAEDPRDDAQEADEIQRAAMETRTQPGSIADAAASPTATAAARRRPSPRSPPRASCRMPSTSRSTSRRRRSTSARKIEGASKTFTLHENGFLEINFARSVHVKRGTVSSYSGNLKFVAESGLLGTTAQTLVKAVGQGKIFVYEKGRKTFLLDLNDEFIYVEGSNLLALEDSLTYRVEPIYDGVVPAQDRHGEDLRQRLAGHLDLDRAAHAARHARVPAVDLLERARRLDRQPHPDRRRRQVARERDDRERRASAGSRSGSRATGSWFSEQ